MRSLGLVLLSATSKSTRSGTFLGFVPKRTFCDGKSEKLAVEARTATLLQRKKVTTFDIGNLKRAQKPITVVTAYDYPSALHVDLAGFDILLVGDSLGMVELVRNLSQLRIFKFFMKMDLMKEITCREWTIRWKLP